MGAAQDLLELMESSTDDKTSCSLVHTTPPPPCECKVEMQLIVLIYEYYEYEYYE